MRLVLEEGKTVNAVAKDLDLTASALRSWVERAQPDRGQGRPGMLTTEERQELAQLRKESRTRHTLMGLWEPCTMSRMLKIGSKYSRSAALDALNLPNDQQHAVVVRGGIIGLFLHNGEHRGWTNAIRDGVLWMSGRASAKEKNKLLQESNGHEIHLLFKENGPEGLWTYYGRLAFEDFDPAISKIRFRLLDLR